MAVPTLGGEAEGAALVTERQNAADVYDRAVRFTLYAPNAMSLTAPMHVRASGESTSAAYRRLRGVAQAMNRYFRYAMLEDPIEVRRRPIANIETGTEAELLAAIPLTERRDETRATGDLDALMGTRFSPDWARTHGGWGLTPRQTYFRILRDYEHARIPWGDRQRHRPPGGDAESHARVFAHDRARGGGAGRHRPPPLGRH